MDEFYIGALGGNQGRGTTKTPVLITVTFDFVRDQKNRLNRYPNFMKMKALAVGEVNGESILDFCEKHISKGSTIYLDSAPFYKIFRRVGIFNVVRNSTPRLIRWRWHMLQFSIANPV